MYATFRFLKLLILEQELASKERQLKQQFAGTSETPTAATKKSTPTTKKGAQAPKGGVAKPATETPGKKAAGKKPRRRINDDDDD